MHKISKMHKNIFAPPWPYCTSQIKKMNKSFSIDSLVLHEKLNVSIIQNCRHLKKINTFCTRFFTILKYGKKGAFFIPQNHFKNT